MMFLIILNMLPELSCHFGIAIILAEFYAGALEPRRTEFLAGRSSCINFVYFFRLCSVV